MMFDYADNRPKELKKNAPLSPCRFFFFIERLPFLEYYSASFSSVEKAFVL